MEESAARVARLLRNDPSIRVRGYTIAAAQYAAPEDEAWSLNLAAEVNVLLEPILELPELMQSERQRLQAQLLKNAIANELSARPSDAHVVLSYYLTTAGFVAQHVASYFGLRHIASARGSDIGKDLLTATGLGRAQFVIERATTVVTTNVAHSKLVQTVGKRSNGVFTVYNGLADNVMPRDGQPVSGSVRLVSLCGYSVKKGTLVLLSAVASLIDRNKPVQLSLAGPSGPGAWSEICERYRQQYPGRFKLYTQIPRDEVRQFLFNGDIYCTASLSEGCSNATMLALALGMPIVSTATGALVELGGGMSHVSLAEPGNYTSFASALSEAVERQLCGASHVDVARLESLIEQMSPDNERAAWQAVIQATLEAPETLISTD